MASLYLTDGQRAQLHAARGLALSAHELASATDRERRWRVSSVGKFGTSGQQP